MWKKFQIYRYGQYTRNTIIKKHIAHSGRLVESEEIYSTLIAHVNIHIPSFNYMLCASVQRIITDCGFVEWSFYMPNALPIVQQSLWLKAGASIPIPAGLSLSPVKNRGGNFQVLLRVI